MGYSPWGRKESDTTERLHSLYEIGNSFPCEYKPVARVFVFDCRVYFPPAGL